MALSETALRALRAYGGEDRWRSAKAVEVSLSAWGWAFRLKLQRPFRPLHARIELAEPRVRFSPIDRAGNFAVLEGSSVRIVDASDRVLARRENPRACFPYGRRLFWWDSLDQAYFSGYALWNYLSLPRLLTREDIEWVEIEPGCLEARFPPHLPTHSRVQRFHFDRETGLLRQHDYTAEVFGSWAKGAHVVRAHAEWNGIPYPSSRRATPRRKDGTPRPFPLLVGIEVHRWELV